MADTDAASYVYRSVSAVLARAEEEKKGKYLSAAELLHASYTPFVVSVDEAFGHEAAVPCRYVGCQVVEIIQVIVMCLCGLR